VSKNPDVLRTPSKTIREAFRALAFCVGSESLATEIICRSPSMVRVSADKMMKVYKRVADKVGRSRAQAQFGKYPSVFKMGSASLGVWINDLVEQSRNRSEG